MSKIGRRCGMLGGAIFLVAAAAFVFYAGRNKPTVLPEIPTVNLDGADPEFARVIRIAREDVSRTPRSAAAWGQLGMVLHAHGFSAAAQVCYGAAVSLQQDDPKWPYLQGYLHHLGPGGPEAALPYFERAASLSPPGSLARLRLADMSLELGRLDDAAQGYRQLLEGNSNDPQAQLGLAKVEIARGEYRKSLQHLASIAGSPVVQKQASAMRASIHDRLGDRIAAERERRRWMELPEDQTPPDDPIIEVLQKEVGDGVYLRMAMDLLEQKRYDEMRSVLEDAIHRYPNSVEIWEALGKTWAAMGDPVRAERALRKSIELAPKSAQSRLSLGNLQVQQQRFQEGAETLQKAIELNPTDGSAHFLLGECRQGLGDTAGAADAYRQALRHSPDHPLASQRLEKLGEATRD